MAGKLRLFRRLRNAGVSKDIIVLLTRLIESESDVSQVIFVKAMKLLLLMPLHFNKDLNKRSYTKCVVTRITEMLYE